MSDHFSGPRAIAGPAGDITDLYVFPSPDRPGQLVLVMNVLPLAKPDSSFSDAIVYRFRLRPLAIDNTQPGFTFGPEESELVFTSTFGAPHTGTAAALATQDGWLTTPSGGTVQFRVNDEGPGYGEGVRVYAGLRSDPFFIDLPSLFESIKTRHLAFKSSAQNSATNFNCLSIVLEVDSEPLVQRAGTPLLGVVAETVVAGKLPIRLERFGRPEVKNVILSMKDFDTVNRELEVRDLDNLEDVFHMSKDYRRVYRARMNANLPVFDHLDGNLDWQPLPDGSHPLTDLLLADYMVVDLGKPYADNTFFEIEQALLDGRPHQTCGGRSLNDDVMDTLYTLLINGGSGPRVSDGVDHATQPASRVFPYLMPPNPTAPTSLPGALP